MYMIRNVFSIVDVLRAERKDGGGGRRCVFTRRRILRRGIMAFFDKKSLIRLCMTI